MAQLWHEKAQLQQQVDRRLTLLHDAEVRWSAAAQRWLNDANHRIYVAQRGDALVGYIVGAIESGPPGFAPEHIGAVIDLTVGLHSDEQGLGRRLLDELRGWFAEREVSHLVARVPRRGVVEQAFWRALGATEWLDYMWMKL
jgi:ribosomal protein S18 acetylase RimI-like enzyme